MSRRNKAGAIATAIAVCLSGLVVPQAHAEPPNNNVWLDRTEYEDKLQAMWLGESMANWTGLRTENLYSEPPFLTDADWGTDKGSKNPYIGSKLEFVEPPPSLVPGEGGRRDVWPADDDTDIEYVYLDAMANTYHDVHLTPERIAAAWGAHVKGNVWVSNNSARLEMERGILPPTTGMNVANTNALMIDAQLTNEIFGALAPGMPEEALRLADLSIRTTAEGHAAYAAQFFVLLYSLAALVDKTLPRRDQVLWLTKEARKYLPNSSKTADIVDFVLQDYLGNDDISNWESTRDKIYTRYQLNAQQNGFIYRSKVESSINLATGVMALLYGQGSFKDTVRIATLSGWDSDNSTASLGGLYGLLYGMNGLRAEFPDRTLHDKYWIMKTRVGFPDYLPEDKAADDTFSRMAKRMTPLVDQVVSEAGGQVRATRWNIIGRPASTTVAAMNPLAEINRRSANNQTSQSGGQVIASMDPPGYDQTSQEGRGRRSPALFTDGREMNFTGVEPLAAYTTFTAAKGDAGKQTFTVEYPRPVQIQAVRAIAGEIQGLQSAKVQYRSTDMTWIDAPIGSTWSRAFQKRPYLQNDLQFATTVTATGIRLIGTLAADSVTTMSELDALSPPGPGAVTVVEAESLTPAAGSPASSVQTDCCGLLWSGNAQLLVRAARAGDTAKLVLSAPKPGRYRIAINYTTAHDFGTVRTDLNGSVLGTKDLGADGRFTVTRISYGEVRLAEGANTLSFTVTGKSASATGYRFGLDTIELHSVD